MLAKRKLKRGMFLLRYEIRKDEVLRYLGYKGQSIDASLDELIESCRNEVRNLSDTKYLYEYFNIEHINLKKFLYNFQLSIFNFKSIPIPAFPNKGRCS